MLCERNVYGFEMLTGRKSGARREDKADVPWGFRMSNNGGNLHKKKGENS